MTMGAPMRYALTVASALACCSGGAFAAEMPKELRGNWCYAPSSERYIRCEDGDLVIEQNSMTEEEGDCKPLAVRNDGANSWTIKEACGFPDNPRDYKSDVRTLHYIIKGRYLHISRAK